MSLRSMRWNERVWEILKRAVVSMSPSIRKKALPVIISACEEEAKKRKSELVEEVDLVRAARERVPEHSRDMCLKALGEQGIRIDKY